MLYLGIDIGKNTHVASLMTSDSKLKFKAFSFKNTTEGGEELLEKLSQFPTEEIEIGMEATGHYWLSLYCFLAENNYKIHVINPIQTDGWRKGIEIRKRKTDTIDSVLIADLIRYGNFLESSLLDEDFMSLRNLSRFRNYIVSNIGDLKRKIICILDQVFPEYVSVVKNLWTDTSMTFLEHFQTAEDFENLTTQQLEDCISSIRMKKPAREKISEISKKAATTFGVKFSQDSFSIQLKFLVEQIKLMENQVKEIESETEKIMKKMNSHITTIPGIGPVTGATILGEIGDISRFSNPAKLAAYAGIDVTVSQSGESCSTRNKMSKRGSPYLRKALFQAALVAAFHDPTFSAFYQKKCAEGKHHLTAIGAVARKLVNIIHAILKNNIPYKVQTV